MSKERAQANNFKEKERNTHFWGTENGKVKTENVKVWKVANLFVMQIVPTIFSVIGLP